MTEPRECEYIDKASKRMREQVQFSFEEWSRFQSWEQS
jgi:hypothetical protein